MAEERGLYNKYRIVNTETHMPVEGHFVLRPDRDPSALAALMHYAQLTPNATLAADLEAWIKRLQR